MKEDFEPFTRELDFSAGEIKTMHIDLERKTFVTSFPSERVLIDTKTQPQAVEAYSLPHGRYAYRIDGGELNVAPVFPDNGLLIAMNISIPICVTISALLTINDLLFPSESGLPLSPTTFSAYGITAAVIGTDVALHIKKRRYLDNAGKAIKGRETAYHMASEYYERGQEALSQNRVNDALDHYTWIVRNCGESLYLPYALYKIARIHLLQGESKLAMQEFELIISQFPLPDLYDKSLKALADLHFAAGHFRRSLDLLDSMVYLDPLYSREEIEQFRILIRGQM
jgi:outer membrane protein assembly factor BamD (BamD/ComL family)